MQMENMTFYRYRVNWWYDAEEGDQDDKGFLLANDYTHAAQQLYEAFDSINFMTIEAVNDSNLLSYEDILEAFGALPEPSKLGPQIVAALQEAIEMEAENV